MGDPIRKWRCEWLGKRKAGILLGMSFMSSAVEATDDKPAQPERRGPWAPGVKGDNTFQTDIATVMQEGTACKHTPAQQLLDCLAALS